MLRRANIHYLMSWLAGGLLGCVVLAEEPAKPVPPPAPAVPAAPVTPPVPPVPPVPAETISEPDRFFDAYIEAVKLVRQDREDAARLVMQEMFHHLSSSPWMEIALLKVSELSERNYARYAMENYQLLRKRVLIAPYYQADTDFAQLFRTALLGALDLDIRRLRLARVRDALGLYFARYGEYPESLAKLSILGYVDLADIRDAQDRPLRYVPTGQVLTPQISYQRYEMDVVPAEPFAVTSPRLQEISRISEQPEKYAVLIRVPGRADPLRLAVGQTMYGYLIAAVGRKGAVVCTFDRVLVLTIPE